MPTIFQRSTQLQREISSRLSKAILREALATDAPDAELQTALECDLSDEHNDLRTAIKLLDFNISKLTNLVQSPQPGNLYIDALKKLMEEIEAGIVVFKIERRDVCARLSAMERVLDVDIRAAEERMRLWENESQNSDPVLTHVKKNEHSETQDTSREHGVLPEVIQFQV